MGLKLNIAICDDEAYYRSQIESLVREYLSGKDVLFCIKQFKSGREFCEEPENTRRFHIIFLDIEMEGMDGMETAYFIRKRNSEMDIVFITVVSDYVFEGYRVNAVRYIMKNDMEKLIPECLTDILKRRRYRGHKMLFSFVGGERTVFLDDILYIESQSHKLQFKTKERILVMYGGSMRWNPDWKSTVFSGATRVFWLIWGISRRSAITRFTCLTARRFRLHVPDIQR